MNDSTNEGAIPLKTLLPEKVEVDTNSVAAYTREGQFMSLGVELLKETGTLTTLLASIYQLDKHKQLRKLTRNEAILAGLMVRLSKLQRGFLDQVCQHKRELADILLRSLMETIINLTFLLKQENSEMLKEYIKYSLRSEKRLLLEIETRVKERGFELPIEKRMKKSIMNAFELSDFSPEEVNEKDTRTWGRSIKNRAIGAGMEDAYLSLIGLPSHAVHGNWQDLITYHLEYEEAGFSPNTEWSDYRPQGLFATALLSTRTNILYLQKLLPQSSEAEELEALLNDLIVRISIVDELHEQFLQKA